jgi:hypothetical protein
MQLRAAEEREGLLGLTTEGKESTLWKEIIARLTGATNDELFLNDKLVTKCTVNLVPLDVWFCLLTEHCSLGEVLALRLTCWRIHKAFAQYFNDRVKEEHCAGKVILYPESESYVGHFSIPTQPIASSQQRCYRCQRMGHISRDCNIACTICGVKGHTLRECKKRVSRK